MDRPFDLVILGHFARDVIVIGEERSAASGGAGYYGGIAAARLGFRTAVVTMLSPADRVHLGTFAEAGVEVFAADAPCTSGIENTYFSADMDRRRCEPLAFAGPFCEAQLPDLTTEILHVAPIMAGEVSLDLLETLCWRYPRVGLDLQGFLRLREGRSLVFRDWPDKQRGLAKVYALKGDAAEAETITGHTELREAARQLAAWGPREVVLTNAQGVLVLAEGRFYEAPFTARSLGGRTGRGDTCMATYLAARSRLDPATACVLAAAVTSLKMEKPGPYDGDRTALDTRLGEAYGGVSIALPA